MRRRQKTREAKQALADRLAYRRLDAALWDLLTLSDTLSRCAERIELQRTGIGATSRRMYGARVGAVLPNGYSVAVELLDCENRVQCGLFVGVPDEDRTYIPAIDELGVDIGQLVQRPDGAELTLADAAADVSSIGVDNLTRHSIARIVDELADVDTVHVRALRFDYRTAFANSLNGKRRNK